MKKLLTLFFILGLSTFSFNLFSQSGLPALRVNQEAKALISEEINKLYDEYKSNPTIEVERKLVLFNKTIEILDEPTVRAVTTEYAVNSAFLFYELKYNPTINDTEAFKRLNQRQWSPNFNDLVNLVKI